MNAQDTFETSNDIIKSLALEFFILVFNETNKINLIKRC